MTAPDATPARIAPPPPASVFEDILEIFYAPSRVFSRHPAGRFWLALVILSVATALVTWAVADHLEPVAHAEMETLLARMQAQNPAMSPDVVERARSGYEMVGKFAAPIALFNTAVSTVILAGLIWLIGKIFGSAQAFAGAMMVATFAAYPRLLKLLLDGLQAAFLLSPDRLTSRHVLSLGPDRFMDAAHASPKLVALASNLDLFNIWVAVLTMIGLRITGRLSTGKSVAATAVLFGLGILLAVTFAK